MPIRFGIVQDGSADAGGLIAIATPTTAATTTTFLIDFSLALNSSSFDIPAYLNHTAMDEIERSLLPLGSAIPSRTRPDLDADQLQDLVFVTMGVTSSACLRIALQRPPGSDRDAMVALTARMLAAALTPDPS